MILIVYTTLIIAGLLAITLAAYWAGHADGMKDGAELESRRLNGDLTSNIDLKQIGI